MSTVRGTTPSNSTNLLYNVISMFGNMAAEVFRSRENSDEFKEPNDGSLRYRPYSAVPAHPYADEALKNRQLDIDRELRKLFIKSPRDVPSEFAQMLMDDYVIAEQRRKMANYEGYMDWLMSQEPIEPELDPLFNHFERGTALIGEILTIGTKTSIKHFEVGQVTHPYRQRLQHVYQLREEVVEEIMLRGGTILPQSVPYRALAIAPRFASDKQLQGFIVRYKRDIGCIDCDSTTQQLNIVERQVAGYRIDAASGFDQAALANLPDNFAQLNPSQQQRALRISGVQDFIEQAVQTDSLDKFVVPVSTTIFAHKVDATLPVQQ